MRSCVLFVGIVLAAAGPIGFSTLAQAAPKQKQAPGKEAAQPVYRFDGTWSVLVVTETGSCDRAYRYSVRIAQGTVSYEGEAGITLTGGVDAGGRVAITLSRGQQGARGSGRLSGDEGSGTWSGQSSTSQCSGYWEAERRGR